MTESKTATSPGQGIIYQIASAVYIVGFLHILYRACLEAYRIRLYAIEEYGRVIHEFDPYFNYRAAEVRLSCFWGL
jgi:asparagine N-glycosylation enzyme membrane subunit Stt3